MQNWSKMYLQFYGKKTRNFNFQSCVYQYKRHNSLVFKNDCWWIHFKIWFSWNFWSSWISSKLIFVLSVKWSFKFCSNMYMWGIICQHKMGLREQLWSISSHICEHDCGITILCHFRNVISFLVGRYQITPCGLVDLCFGYNNYCYKHLNIS